MRELGKTALLIADLIPIFDVKFDKHAERMLNDLFSPLLTHALNRYTTELSRLLSELP